jgi:hypothetical protein
MPELRRFVEAAAGEGPSVEVGAEALEKCPPNVELCGHWMFNTSKYVPYRDYFRSLFVPPDDIKRPLDDAIARLRERGETLIGIQVRRGDFLSSPISTFTFAVPPSWWKQWVRGVWESSPKPVLFIASDDPTEIVRELAEFSPLTAKDLNVTLPPRAKGAGFFIDHYVLSQCDRVGISNSSFGFTACMLNTRATLFARATPSAHEPFLQFDPWNALPLLHFGKKPTRKTLAQMISMTYRTQGLGETFKCLGWHLPRAMMKGASMRTGMAYQSDGMGGALRSLGRSVIAPFQ